MAETTRPALEMLHEVVDAWLRRNERRAATEAGSLTFWRDGMLRLLQQIADGEASRQPSRRLPMNLESPMRQ